MKKIKKITLFLASSKELFEERKQFEIEIYRKCKTWFEEGFFLHLDVWEDLSAQMQINGSQKAYNEKVKSADIFILLAHTKVGQYTAEEFETAFGAFQAKEKPFIFTYFKDNNGIENKSLTNFQNKLKALNHFYSSYQDFNDLWKQFNKELDELKSSEFIEHSHSKNISGLHIEQQIADQIVIIEKIEGTVNF